MRAVAIFNSSSALGTSGITGKRTKLPGVPLLIILLVHKLNDTHDFTSATPSPPSNGFILHLFSYQLCRFLPSPFLRTLY